MSKTSLCIARICKPVHFVELQPLEILIAINSLPPLEHRHAAPPQRMAAQLIAKTTQQSLHHFPLRYAATPSSIDAKARYLTLVRTAILELSFWHHCDAQPSAAPERSQAHPLKNTVGLLCV